MTNELFFCTNCLKHGELNQQLRCQYCNSEAVVSMERIKQASRQVGEQLSASFAPTQTRVITKKLFRVTQGPFYTTVYAEDAYDAIIKTKRDFTRTWQLNEDLPVEDIIGSEIQASLVEQHPELTGKL